jgi:hypothetical protein
MVEWVRRPDRNGFPVRVEGFSRSEPIDPEGHIGESGQSYLSAGFVRSSSSVEKVEFIV